MENQAENGVTAKAEGSTNAEGGIDANINSKIENISETEKNVEGSVSTEDIEQKSEVVENGDEKQDESVEEAADKAVYDTIEDKSEEGEGANEGDVKQLEDANQPVIVESKTEEAQVENVQNAGI